MTPLVLPLLPQSMAKNCPPVPVYQKKFLDSYFAIRPLLLAKSLGCQTSRFMRWDQYDVTAVGSSLLLVREFHGGWVVLRVGTVIDELLYLSEHNPGLGLLIAILVHCFARNFAFVLCPCLLSKKIFFMILLSSCPPFGKDEKIPKNINIIQPIMLHLALLLASWSSDTSLIDLRLRIYRFI